jgi:four helix bundle protein
MSFVAFQDLEVYQLAESLADKAWFFTLDWPCFARDTVGKQLVRAADSIGANIAEGSGRGSSRDNRRFVRIARGSLNETRHWLRRAFRRKLLDQGKIEALKTIVDELGPRLNAYLTSMDRSKPKET